MKLWEKGYRLDADVERYTVGDDYLLDQALVRYDCLSFWQGWQGGLGACRALCRLPYV